MAYQDLSKVIKALRKYGLTVEVVPGAETRGSSVFAPFGVLDHWTAGSKYGDRGSLYICINGRAGLPGPLCNFFLTRSGHVVIVAMGRANHAGAGYYKGADGNTDVWGIEGEMAGPGDDWTDAQKWAYPRLNAALMDLGANFVAGHDEYALPKGRKQDIGSFIHTLRADTNAVRTGSAPVAAPENEDELSAADVKEIKDYVRALLLDGYTTGGQAHAGVAKVVEETQRRVSEENRTVRYIQRKSGGAVYATDGLTKVGIPNPTVWGELKRVWGDSPLEKVEDAAFDLIPTVQDVAALVKAATPEINVSLTETDIATLADLLRDNLGADLAQNLAERLAA